MASKQVSKEQGLLFGGKLLQGEELYRLVKKVFFNSDNLPALARAYAGHHQIVCAVLECEGGNEYLSKRKGMSFGIRKSYMTSADGEGVMMVPEPVMDGESLSDQILMDRQLKYKPPDIRQLTKGKLSGEMIRIIRENAEVERMSDEVREFWEELEESNAAVAAVAEQEASESEALVDCCVGSGGEDDGSGSGDDGDSGGDSGGGGGGGEDGGDGGGEDGGDGGSGESRDVLMKHNNNVLKDMCKIRKLRVGGNKRKLVDRLLGLERPRVRQFRHEFGHGVPLVPPLPTDTITGGSVEKDGGGDEDGEDGRDDDGGSVCMLVDEDGDADQVNCRLAYDLENRHGLIPVAPHDSEGYRDRDHADGSGLVAGETGNSNMGGVSSSSQLAPCGGCGMPVGGAHRCPGCGANMHTFCGDGEGEEGYGQKIRCPKCRC